MASADARELIHRAVAALQRNACDEAAELADAVLERFGPEANSLMVLAGVRVQAGDLTGAIELYERARALMPRHIHVLVTLASLYRASGDLGQARSALEAALQVDPGFALLAASRNRAARAGGYARIHRQTAPECGAAAADTAAVSRGIDHSGTARPARRRPELLSAALRDECGDVPVAASGYRLRGYQLVMRLVEVSRRKLPLRLHTVRYEDLIAAFDQTVRGLLRFLELEWSEHVARYAETARKRTIATPGAGQVVRPLYGSARGKWLHYREFLEPCLPALAPWVRPFGYERPANPSP